MCLVVVLVQLVAALNLTEELDYVNGPFLQALAGNDSLVGTRTCTTGGPLMVYCVDQHVRTISAINQYFSGVIDGNIAQLTTLVTLFLSGNSLRGNIPLLSDSVQSLWLQNNRLEALPAVLPLSLQSLYLQNNNISGSLPAFEANRSLSTINLSNNYLSGIIQSFLPSPISNFDVSHNALEGCVPNGDVLYTMRIAVNRLTCIELATTVGTCDLIDINDANEQNCFPCDSTFIATACTIEHFEWCDTNYVAAHCPHLVPTPLPSAAPTRAPTAPPATMTPTSAPAAAAAADDDDDGDAAAGDGNQQRIDEGVATTAYIVLVSLIVALLASALLLLVGGCVLYRVLRRRLRRDLRAHVRDGSGEHERDSSGDDRAQSASSDGNTQRRVVASSRAGSKRQSRRLSKKMRGAVGAAASPDVYGRVDASGVLSHPTYQPSSSTTTTNVYSATHLVRANPEAAEDDQYDRVTSRIAM